MTATGCVSSSTYSLVLAVWRQTVKTDDFLSKLLFGQVPACNAIFGSDAFLQVPAGSPSRGGDVAALVFDIHQPLLPTPFYSVLVPISVFMALSTVFLSITSPDKYPLSHSVLPVLFLPYWLIQPYISS